MYRARALRTTWRPSSERVTPEIGLWPTHTSRQDEQHLEQGKLLLRDVQRTENGDDLRLETPGQLVHFGAARFARHETLTIRAGFPPAGERDRRPGEDLPSRTGSCGRTR